MSEFHSRANKEQLEAIKTTDGPLLIIAGPGSGKTFTLVERVVYLITEKGVRPRKPSGNDFYGEGSAGIDHADLKPFV